MSCFIYKLICSRRFTNFLVLLHGTLAQKIIYVLIILYSVHVTINITNIISYFSCSDYAADEIKLGTIGADIKHLPMSTPIPKLVALSYPPPSKSSNVQPMKFQNLDKHMI